MTSVQVVCYFCWFSLSGTAVQLSGRTPGKNFLRESCLRQEYLCFHKKSENRECGDGISVCVMYKYSYYFMSLS